jgi:peptidoglycan/LPS O-acetylase OafA/YrhL
MGFGTLRFFLAFLVAISHLWIGMIHGPAAYAVWCFFVLSGFLMTFVLINKYGSTYDGLKSFAINRFLRIYPMYFIAAIFGALLIFQSIKYNLNLEQLNPQFKFPQSPGDWGNNIFLLPLFGGSSLLVPVSGALAVEVMAYILMPLLAFSKRAAWLGLVLALGLNFHNGIYIENFLIRYSSFFTAYLAFSLGSLICHYRAVLAKYSFPMTSYCVWVLHGCIWIFFDPWPWTYGLYFSLILSGWLIVSLHQKKSNSLDNFLGDLSYPIYLFHTLSGGFVAFFLGFERNLFFFIISFLLTLIISIFLIIFLDQPIQSFRNNMRKNIDF